MKSLYSVLVVCSLLVASAASAGAKLDHPCKSDFFKFCAGKVVCGKGACHACLNDHRDKLDPKCEALMDKWDEKEETRLSNAVLSGQ
jgi:hypothetical protein